MPTETPQQAQPKAPGSGFATASLILAIASLPLTILCLSGVLTALLAITLGHVALRQARHSPAPLPTRNKAIAGLVISYLYVAFGAILVATVIVNRVSKTDIAGDTGMNFSIRTPLKGTTYEWQRKHRAPLVVVMAPADVEISTTGNVGAPFTPDDVSDFQYLSVNLIPKKYQGTVVDVARQLASGTGVFDKSYSAQDPELLTISGIPSAVYRESLTIHGAQVKGMAFLVPCDRGYYLLTFRCDPRSYDESFYRRIAHTFSPKEQ